MLECAGTFQNYRAIMALGQNVLRHYCWREEKREKRFMHRAIESALDVILHNTGAALKERDYYLIIKLRITFNGDKLHRYN